MVRVPAIVVALACAGIISVAGFGLTMWLHEVGFLIVALPLAAGIGGFISGRWALWPAIVPGLTLGVLMLAVQLGLGLGMYNSLFHFVDPTLALLQLIAAITGGMLGTMIARRSTAVPAPTPDFRAL